MSFFDNYVDSPCITCGISIPLTPARLADLKQTGRTFYCTNGHPQVFSESEVTRLKRQLEEMTRYRDNAVADRDDWKRRRDHGVEEEKRLARRIYSLRGVITRMKNKAKREQ